MDDTRDLRLKHLGGQLGELVSELTRMEISCFDAVDAWSPAVNAYRCDGEIIVCVELAGVSLPELDLRVEKNRLLLRGRRKPPEPRDCEPQPVQILAMEISHGEFSRELDLPLDVDPSQARIEQTNGLLWIHLPVAAVA